MKVPTLETTIRRLNTEIEKSCVLEENLLKQGALPEKNELLEEKFLTRMPSTRKDVAEYCLGGLLVIDVLPSNGCLSETVKKTWIYGEPDPIIFEQRLVTSPKIARQKLTAPRIMTLYSISHEAPVRIASHYRKKHYYLREEFKKSLENHYRTLLIMSETDFKGKGYGKFQERAFDKAFLLGLTIPFSDHVLDLTEKKEITFEMRRAIYDYWEAIKEYGWEPNNFYSQQAVKKLGWNFFI